MNKITSPADLAEFKHRVPDGVKAPGQPVLGINGDGTSILLDDGANMAGFSDHTYWTREPVEPRPELPTALGSVILNVRTEEGEKFPQAMRVNNRNRWIVSNSEGYFWLNDSDIAFFDYARIVSNIRNVLDEADKSPVVDHNGGKWSWDYRTKKWRSGIVWLDTKNSIDFNFGPIAPACDEAETGEDES